MSGITVAPHTYFLQFNLDFSTIYLHESFSRSESLFRVTWATGEYEEFRGEGLSYDSDGKLISGTVTSYAYYMDGKEQVRIVGLPVEAELLAVAAETYELDDDAIVLIKVLKGDDTLSGGKYSDVLAGFDGNDIINGRAGNDSLYGYNGNDIIIGGVGIDSMYGGQGTDTVSYATAAVGVTASLVEPTSNTNDAKGDFYDSIENLRGSRYNDVLVGNSGKNVLSGGDGYDSLSGGDGNDTLIGGARGDKLYGGAGVDAASYANATAGVISNLGMPSINTGDAKGDRYSSIENLIGSKYADELYGTDGQNRVAGGDGNDIIDAGSGNDWIYGGAGADRLYGGAGSDKFVFKALSESAGSTFDSIFDFSPRQTDRIDLSAIDASTMASGNQAFTFVGTAAFKGVAGELRYVKQASDTYIYADVNGDKLADLKIRLQESMALTKDYFIL